jgi:hypothetical protein
MADFFEEIGPEPLKAPKRSFRKLRFPAIRSGARHLGSAAKHTVKKERQKQAQKPEKDRPDRSPLRDVGPFAAPLPSREAAADRAKNKPANDEHSAPLPGPHRPKSQPLPALSATAAMSRALAWTTLSGPKP